jgi:hypothetical protein
VKRVTSLAAALALGATVLSGCSGGTEAYCDSLEQAQSDFDAFETGDFAGFGDFIDRSREIASEAPDEVSEEWDTVVAALDQFETVLEDAGVDFEELENLEAGEIPEGLDIGALTEAAQEFDTEELEGATETISTHAKDECDVDLG